MRVKPKTLDELKQLKEVLPDIKDCIESELEEKEDKESNDIYKYNIDIKNLPSRGVTYPKGAIISYKPLTFGDVKYFSNSNLSDYEFFKFFYDNKVNCSFNKSLITFYDFQFIVFLIKMSVFGDNTLGLKWTCSKCETKNSVDMFFSDIEFYDLDVKLPITLTLEDGEILEFMPETIGDYLKRTKNHNEDENARIAFMIKNKPFNEALELVNEKLVGKYVQSLEMIDLALFHGVKPKKFACKECGFIAEFPFYEIEKYITTSEETREFIRTSINIDV